MFKFQKKFGTIFLKEDSEANQFIEKMNDLSGQATGTLKTEIDKQVNGFGPKKTEK